MLTVGGHSGPEAAPGAGQQAPSEREQQVQRLVRVRVRVRLGQGRQQGRGRHVPESMTTCRVRPGCRLKPPTYEPRGEGGGGEALRPRRAICAVL